MAFADSSFKALFPNDAQYRVTKWEAVLMREGRVVLTKTCTQGSGNLSSFATEAIAGYRVIVDVREV